jgi:ferredoxin
MEEIRKYARELLAAGTVQLVIGYENCAGNKVRPVFATKPDHTSALVFDSRCVHNLAVYVTKQEVRKNDRIAVIASVPVMRSIIQLASENQVTDKDILVVGITPEFEIKEFSSLKDVEDYVNQYKVSVRQRDEEIMQNLSGMNAEERWQFWMKTLEPCFKCYACRAACPLCYCTRCTVDMNRPQWVPVASHALGNLEWHIMRAMHMAGRCTGCDACADACPLGIPLNLLTRKIRQDMEAEFGEASPSLSGINPMVTFKPDDKENFIR